MVPEAEWKKQRRAVCVCEGWGEKAYSFTCDRGKKRKLFLCYSILRFRRAYSETDIERKHAEVKKYRVQFLEVKRGSGGN